MTGEGAMLLLAPCIRCGRLFTCNPLRVPSVRLRPDGPREPLCRPCAEWTITERTRVGLPVVPIYDDAYEAAPETEAWPDDD